MRSFRINKVNARRATFLSLVSQIGSQLRDAYALKSEQGLENQASLAKKLNVDRSAINRRLTGRTNMTLQSLADMVWSLGYAIRVIIFDPANQDGRNWSPSVAKSDVGIEMVPPSNIPRQMKTLNPNPDLVHHVH